MSGRKNKGDDRQAENKLLESAGEGNEGSAYQLAYMYHNDCLGKKDYEKAIYWYELAAVEGDENAPKAQNALAELYLSGEGIEKDVEKGAYFLQLLANSGDEAASAKLDALDIESVDPALLAGAYIQGGQGRMKNAQKAGYWLLKAAGNHQIEYKARYKLAMLQSVLDEEDYTEAVRWLENSANEGNEFARAMLNCHYEEGTDLRKKMREEGEAHLQLAMEAADADDPSTASAEYLKSLMSFTPAIEADKYREIAREIKEKYKKRDHDRLKLTKREQEILALLLSGAAPKEIAYNLKISYPTVNFHSNNLYRKLGIQSRAELFAKFRG